MPFLAMLGWSTAAGAGLWALDQARQLFGPSATAVDPTGQLSLAQQQQLQQQQGAMAADLALYQQHRPGAPGPSLGLVVTAGLVLSVGVIAVASASRRRR